MAVNYGGEMTKFTLQLYYKNGTFLQSMEERWRILRISIVEDWALACLAIGLLLHIQ